MNTPAVPVDDGGIRVDALRGQPAPAVLLTPAHQFPTGVVLDGGRRRELLAWAADGGLVIEDDYDAEHRYDRPPVTALHAQLGRTGLLHGQRVQDSGAGAAGRLAAAAPLAARRGGRGPCSRHGPAGPRAAR